MKPHTFAPLTPKVVLGVAAHPDDLDFGASGSMAKWASAGADVYYLLLTDGSKGSDDPNMTSVQLIKTRQAEQLAAAKVIGLKEVFFLDYEDGLLVNSVEVKRDIARVIRKVKPDVLVTMDPSMTYSLERGYINHPDHRAAGQAALDAVFPLARDRLSFPELLAEGYEPHKTPTVLMIHFEKHNFYVDITETVDQKMEALRAHESQMANIEETHIRIRGMAKQVGEAAGFEYAEGFLRIDIG